MVHYFEDILVHTGTFKDHLQALKEVLRLLQTNGLTAKPVKTETAKISLVFLGHIIREVHIGPDDNNVSKIMELKLPQTKRQV